MQIHYELCIDCATIAYWNISSMEHFDLSAGQLARVMGPAQEMCCKNRQEKHYPGSSKNPRSNGPAKDG